MNRRRSNLAPPAPIRGAVRKRRLRPVDVLRTGLNFKFLPWGAAEAAPHHPPAAPLAVLRIGLNFKFCRAGTSGRGSVINLLRRPRCPCSAAIHPPGIRLPALPAASGCTQDIRKPEAAGLHHLKLPLCRKDVPACVEINQCDGCTKSFLGDDAAVLARSSGEEPAFPRHRAGVASMTWRSSRRFSTNAP